MKTYLPCIIFFACLILISISFLNWSYVAPAYVPKILTIPARIVGYLGTVGFSIVGAFEIADIYYWENEIEEE